MRAKRAAECKRYRLRVLAEARVWHAHLIHVLGGKCARCDNSEELPLSIEHVNGRQWDVRKYRLDARVKRYWAEYRAGVPLLALCIPCNSGGGYQYWGFRSA